MLVYEDKQLYGMEKYGTQEGEAFRIKAYGLQELGMLYFPNSTPRAASSQLKKWINNNGKLLARMMEAGYYNGQKILTPKQVRIIVEHLDPP
jgi:hypothetical protein